MGCKQAIVDLNVHIAKAATTRKRIHSRKENLKRLNRSEGDNPYRGNMKPTFAERRAKVQPNLHSERISADVPLRFKKSIANLKKQSERRSAWNNLAKLYDDVEAKMRSCEDQTELAKLR